MDQFSRPLIEIAGILTGLVEASLVQFSGDRGYRLLVPIREFALERLTVPM